VYLPAFQHRQNLETTPLRHLYFHVGKTLRIAAEELRCCARSPTPAA
jgi:hypothetical protein